MSTLSVTGDVRNNINKLRKELALVNYRPPNGGADAIGHHPAFFDAAERRFLEGLLSGSPQTILPILHHALLDYSPLLANHLFERGLYDLYAKTDARFLESVWRICRDEFAYRPTIKKEHLLSKSGKYVERKVMFATDFVAECRKKHAELARLARPGSAGRIRRQSDTQSLGSTGPPSRRASWGKPEEDRMPSTPPSSSRSNSAFGHRNGVLKEKQEQAALTRRQGPTALRPKTIAAAPGVARAWRTDVKQTRYCAAPVGPQVEEYEDEVRTVNIVPTAHPSAMLHSIERRQFPAHRAPGDQDPHSGIEDVRRAADSAGADTAGDIVLTSEVHEEPPSPLKPRTWEGSRSGKQHACAEQQHLLTAPGSPTFPESRDGPTLWSYLTPGHPNGTTGSEKQEIVAARPSLLLRKPFENGNAPGPTMAVDSAAEREARSHNGVSVPEACHAVAREACDSRAAQHLPVIGAGARLRVSPPEFTSTSTNGLSLPPSPSRQISDPQISDPLGRRGASQNGRFQSAECEARIPHRSRETSASDSGPDEEADGTPRVESQEVEALVMSDSDEIKEVPPRRIDRQRSDDVPLSAALEDVLEEVEANLTDFSRHLRTVNSHLRSLDARITAVERRLEECAVEPQPPDLQGSAADPSHRSVTSETHRQEAPEDGLKQGATSPERGRCQHGGGNMEETFPADDRRNSRGASSEGPAPAQSASTGLREMTAPPGDSNSPRQTEPARRSPSPRKPDDRALAAATTGVESEKAGRLIQNISERFRVTRQLLGKDAGGEPGRALR